MNNTEASIEIITPELAKQYLSTSEGNRNIRIKTVEKYARDILNDEWQLNGETIVFSRSGHLLNGHHRLNAVIRANKPITAVIVRGIVDSTDLFDRGVPRSTSDNFKFSGYESWMYQSQSIALAKFCLNFVCSNTNPSDYEVKKFMEENKEAIQFTYDISNMGKSKNKYQKKAPILAAVFYAFKEGVAESTIVNFIRILNTGFYSDDSELSAIVFRNWVITSPSIGNHTERKDMFYKSQEAIDSFNKGYARKAMFRGLTGIYSDKYKK